MKLAVIGSGYVGLTSGTCFAEMGSTVICVDKDQAKIELLNSGKVPIHEPGLDEMVKRCVDARRLFFTTDLEYAVQQSRIIFIAVGTPPGEDGSADLQYVLAAAREIAQYMNADKIVVNKSTVPVGTGDLVTQEIAKVLASRKVEHRFAVVSNPEFLKEGAAIDDFMHPDRVVIGTQDHDAAELMKTLYAPFCRTHDRILIMNLRSAEMTKYAANALLATKISFINEISRLCELYGADVSEVRNGIGSDTRIGYKFIYPGVGYGGSCFPKDIKALIHMASQQGYNSQILKAVEDVNAAQKLVLVNKIKKHFGADLSGLCFAIWGLAFKPNTDDMREAPSVVIINALLEAGAIVRAYDPVAMDEAKKMFAQTALITFCDNDYAALEGADAMILITEWHQFRYPDFGKMAELLKQQVIFDGRNLYNPTAVRELGFSYYAIGRP